MKKLTLILALVSTPAFAGNFSPVSELMAGRWPGFERKVECERVFASVCVSTDKPDGSPYDKEIYDFNGTQFVINQARKDAKDAADAAAAGLAQARIARMNRLRAADPATATTVVQLRAIVKDLLDQEMSGQ